MTFGTIEQAIEDLKNGKLVIVADDEDRENEGDLVCAAELVTPETVNFMSLHGRGLICLALTGDRCDQLGLPQMTERNTEDQSTAFTVSIDAERRFGVTTGISAADRAKTIAVAIDPATAPADLRRPGHVFPLRGAHEIALGLAVFVVRDDDDLAVLQVFDGLGDGAKRHAGTA